jgi:tetratricopeptide (TPR) repeat protein|tara:strand:+ start:1083 stop:1520 length:438 start_codon:yes stop_codon:yes gene_type:complete
MTKIREYIILACTFLTFTSFAIGNDSFFDDALKMYNEKKYDDAKFLFERNIVYNPKSADSYLYLAKIYNKKDDKKKEQQNLNTVLLIEPSNEEAILMIMKISLEKSNYSKVQKLSETFAKVCKNLCDENDKIKESLKNIESKNES